MRTEMHARLYEILVEAADAGVPCPTTTTLEGRLGLTHSRVQVLVEHLIADGEIVIERGPANPNVRRIQIVATGAWTDWTSRARPGNGGDMRSYWQHVEDADAYMAERMAALRARGKVCRYEDVRLAPPTGRRLYSSAAADGHLRSSAA
jgi:hypothetical protein